MDNRESWWNHKYGKNSKCPISHTRLRSGKNKYGLSRTIKLKCRHIFGRNALVKWVLTSNNTCPLCRVVFDDKILFI